MISLTTARLPYLRSSAADTFQTRVIQPDLSGTGEEGATRTATAPSSHELVGDDAVAVASFRHLTGQGNLTPFSSRHTIETSSHTTLQRHLAIIMAATSKCPKKLGGQKPPDTAFYASTLYVDGLRRPSFMRGLHIDNLQAREFDEFIDSWLRKDSPHSIEEASGDSAQSDDESSSSCSCSAERYGVDPEKSRAYCHAASFGARSGNRWMELSKSVRLRRADEPMLWDYNLRSNTMRTRTH